MLYTNIPRPHLYSWFRNGDHVDEGALLGRVDGAAVRAVHASGEANDATARRRELPSKVRVKIGKHIALVLQPLFY